LVNSKIKLVPTAMVLELAGVERLLLLSSLPLGH